MLFFYLSIRISKYFSIFAFETESMKMYNYSRNSLILTPPPYGGVL